MFATALAASHNAHQKAGFRGHVGLETPDMIVKTKDFKRLGMREILKVLLLIVGVAVLLVVLVAAGAVITEALDGYEQHRSVISEGAEE